MLFLKLITRQIRRLIKVSTALPNLAEWVKGVGLTGFPAKTRLLENLSTISRHAGRGNLVLLTGWNDSPSQLL